jgi:hypothetical protein
MAWKTKRLWLKNLVFDSRNGRLVSGGEDDSDHWISLGPVTDVYEWEPPSACNPNPKSDRQHVHMFTAPFTNDISPDLKTINSSNSKT